MVSVTDQQKLEALLNTVAPMSEEELFYRVLIYGDPGVGKTKLATDCGTKILYVESDPYGWVTLADWPENRAKCTRMIYKGLSQLETIALAYEQQDEYWTAHDLIVIDTLSAIATLDLDVVFKTRIKKGDDDIDFAAVTQPDIGVNTERVRRTLMRLLALPVNIIMTSHVREDLDKAVMYTRPGFTPKVRKDIERMQTMIGYLTCNTGVDEDGKIVYDRKMQVHPTKTIVAKSRIGGLPVVIKDPDLATILNEWVDKGKPLSNEVLSPLTDSVGLKPPSVENVESDTSTGLEI